MDAKTLLWLIEHNMLTNMQLKSVPRLVTDIQDKLDKQEKLDILSIIVDHPEIWSLGYIYSKHSYSSIMSIACKNDFINIIYKLINLRVLNIGHGSNYIREYLLDACEHGCVNAANLLLDYIDDYLVMAPETSLSIIRGDNYQILTRACLKGHLEIVKLLLNRGLTAEDIRDNCSLFLKSYCKDDSFKKINSSLPTSLSYRGFRYVIERQCTENAFISACLSGNIDVVTLLLNTGADLTNITYIQAFRDVCRLGYSDIAELLIRCGLTPADMRSFNNSSFQDACANGHCGIVKIFLNLNVGLKDITADNNNALSLACKNKHIDIVNMILDYPPVKRHTLNILRINDNVVFRKACAAGSVDIVKILLSQGLTARDICTCNNRALRNAHGGGHIKVVKLIFNYLESLGIEVTQALGASYNVYFQQACGSGNIELVQLSLNYGLTVDDIRSNKNTPLRTAIRACINMRPYKYYRSNVNSTKLQYASIKIVQLLLSKGLTTEDIKDCNSKMLYRARFSDNGKKLLQILLTHVLIEGNACSNKINAQRYLSLHKLMNLKIPLKYGLIRLPGEVS
jgi:ankyrin repeat protein